MKISHLVPTYYVRPGLNFSNKSLLNDQVHLKKNDRTVIKQLGLDICKKQPVLSFLSNSRGLERPVFLQRPQSTRYYISRVSTYFGRANNDKNTANQVDSQQYDADDKEIKHDIGQICNFFIVFWW